MKTFLNLIFLLGMASAIRPMADLTTKQQGLESRNGNNDPAIHRKLMGCTDDFVCPEHSERKRGRDCYDSFSDCECILGYERQGNACVAEQGLCNMDYVDMVQAKQDEVEFWIEQAYASTDQEEIYGYIQLMDLVLSEAWDDYNKGKASCEMYVFDDDGERRLLCCSGLRNAFKGLADGFKKVAKAVVNFVVESVEIVVDVVVEIVECGVGIVTDGAKCGLVGCAFGLVGVALDIAFTLATGGLNKSAEALCSVSELVGGEGGDDDDDGCTTQQCKEQKALSKILEGIGNSVCAVNEKIESPLLEEVCDISEALEEADNGLAFLELFVPNEVVFRFVTLFRTAMCGEPGSAVLDLLEEVVSCSIGCADEDNVFCDEATQNASIGAPPTGAPPTGNPPVEDPSIEYQKHDGTACRTSSGERGDEGTDYTLFPNKSENQCENLCSDNVQCQGWEYNSSSNRCEIWDTKPEQFEDKEDFDCYVKLE